MRKIILFVLLAALALNLCGYVCAEGSVCISADGRIGFEHNYSRGVCVDCGFVFEDCIHENTVSAGVPFEKIEKLADEGHARTYFYSDTCSFCQDCGNILDEGGVFTGPESRYVYEYEIQDHTMQNSVCVKCGYIQVMCFKKY